MTGFLRHAFWWLVSLAAFALAAAAVRVVLVDKPWLTLVYVPVGLAVAAGLIANPLVRPRIGLGRRPVTTLALLAVLALAAAAVGPFIVQQTQEYRGQPTAQERANRDLIDRGNALLDAPEGRRDVSGALALFRQACDAADGLGCFNAALLLNNKDSELYDPEAARTAYVFACNVRLVQAACGNLALMLETGAGGPRDVPQAYELFVQACHGEVDAACGNLESVTADFRRDGTPAEALNALATAKLFCSQGSREAVCAFSRLPG